MKMQLFRLISLALATSNQFSLARPAHKMPGGASKTKFRLSLLCLLTFLLILLTPGSASANWYHLCPPGTYVNLDPIWDFLVSNPYNSNPDNPYLRLPIGDNYGQHPGWYGDYPNPPNGNGDYSIGVFAHSIGEYVYLWETSSVGFPQSPLGQDGPIISVGYWDEATLNFTQYGSTVTVVYHDTGAIGGSGMEINCDIIPLSDFDVQGNPYLNAVEITVNPNEHNQVTAVATIPEPSTMGLLCAGILGFLGYRWQRGKGGPCC